MARVTVAAIPEEILDFHDWLRLGIERGWCSEPVCGMHDGFPMDEFEAQEYEDGGDPCGTIVRIWV